MSLVRQAKRATVEDLEAHPARISLADAIKHILWVADNYDALEREFPDHPWNATMVRIRHLITRDCQILSARLLTT